MKDFSSWLIDELKERGMSQADLARATGLTTGGITHLVNKSRKPSTDTCNAIAKAFKLPPDYVFIKAGLLPETETDAPPGIHELNAHYRTASEDVQREILEFARFKTR